MNVETIMLNGFETSSCMLTILDICSVLFSRNHTMLSLLFTLIYVSVRLPVGSFYHNITFQSEAKYIICLNSNPSV